ncbi:MULTISPECIES: pilus assembly protein TadG-related protein [Bacillaceae]|uniref:Putative Flp pilus-assembly TadG-like N-terminal domain-containing protein n=1 Tax=Evansella alkalicola TaxID=745819 RepID=A0ABS6JVP7_9BACI|nr:MULTISPECIES: pilus assembly protein TadG-related protein [Bacillaceae]MBU9721317.1 hypothetical protein [Bacillus alkalicola]
MKNLLKKEDGAVIILVAFSMSIFIAMLALVIDFGSLYLEKNRMQKIADAAALAGAQELPSNFSRAQQQVHHTILLNSGDPSNFRSLTNQGNTLLEVTGSKQGTLFFGKAIGIKEPTISARAVVELKPLQSGTGSIPLGIQPSHNLAFGSLQTIKVSESASGNFGAIALTGSGANNYENDLRNGFNYELKVNTTLNTQTGQIAGPTQRAVNDRIASCPDATYLNYPPNCARVVLIPVYTPVQTEQNQIKQVRVVGFATFFLESVSSTRDGAEVTGRFIQASSSGQAAPAQSNYGTFGYGLTQ